MDPTTGHLLQSEGYAVLLPEKLGPNAEESWDVYRCAFSMQQTIL
jgi:hypothetical protein